MAAGLVDEDPTKNDNIGCKTRIFKLAEELKGIASNDEDNEMKVKHLMDAIDVGNGLVKTCVYICSSLMSAIDQLAMTFNMVLDDVNKKIPSENVMSTDDAETSSLMLLIQTAENFAKLIEQALGRAGSTKKMATALANVSRAIASDLASADKLVEDSLSEAKQLLDECSINSEKLKIDVRIARDAIQIALTETSGTHTDDDTLASNVSEIFNACEEAKDVSDDAAGAVENLERVTEKLRMAIEEEKSQIYGTKIRQATEESRESLERAELMQKLLNTAVGKVRELVKGVEDIQHEQSVAKVKSELTELKLCFQEYQSQIEYVHRIVNTVSQIDMNYLVDADEDIKKIVENMKTSADDTVVITAPAKKSLSEFEEKLIETEKILDTEAMSDGNLILLERLRGECEPKCAKARKAAKATEIKMYKFIQSDPNRQKAEDAYLKAKVVIEETLAIVKNVRQAAVEFLGNTETVEGENATAEKRIESVNQGPQSPEYWQTTETTKLAETTLQAAKKAETAVSRTSKLVEECQKAMSDSTVFIDANLVSNLISRTKECQYAIFQGQRSLEELQDVDPRNWPVLGLPPRVGSPLCVLRAPRRFMDNHRNKITCSFLERSPVSPAAANQKQISMVVTPQLLSTGGGELPVPALLAIKYDCKNDYGGDIIVKSSKSRKKWSVLPTISTERRIDEFPNMVFAEVKVQNFESYAVLLRSVRAISTVDDKGGEIAMQSKHPLFISIQPGCLTGPTDVTLETATPDTATKTLKYAEPFVRTTFSPTPRKSVRLVLATRPPIDRTPVVGGQVNHLYCLYCVDNKRWKVSTVLEGEQTAEGLIRVQLPPTTINQQLLMALLWNANDPESLEETLSLEQGKGMSKEMKERHIFEACLSDEAFKTLSRHLTDEVEHLAVYLGVGDHTLKKIKSNKPDSRTDQAKQVLIGWRQKTKGDNQKKVGLLRSALHKCKRLDMAQKVQNDLRDALNWGL
ncbi:putative leucine-rich repeat-containing protein DDB_G0290503 [Ptychodera flava]|uniref:putative leucine-rich repeat-containing protein DDB_G0290503 n=1 Tax=Ptychodera flava TaxID=63121 RepID=UPI00396A7D4B